MNIVQITPGAGGMYCGNCFRDNALVAALRGLGHPTLMVPLYLPMTLDEEDQSAGIPIFFGGINVYLEQKSGLFRHAPGWLHRWLASPRLLKWAAGRAARTRPEDVGDLTLSMLRGEEGKQARELEELIGWLKTRAKPDVICLSNAMLAGMIRRLKSELGAPVVCMLQGEDYFLDSLPEPRRGEVWKTLAERVGEADVFVAPSRYFRLEMSGRLGLDPGRVRTVYNGIALDGYPAPGLQGGAARPEVPVLGYFARMCKEKGLDLLVDAFVRVARRSPSLLLKIGGSRGPSDEPFVEVQRRKLERAGLLDRVSFHANLDRVAKLEFLKSLTLFSVPALYGEAFGLYVIEALAAGVPVVQVDHGAFPELVAATGGGVIAGPNANALAEAIQGLLERPERIRQLGQVGRAAVWRQFGVGEMARGMVEVFEGARRA